MKNTLTEGTDFYYNEQGFIVLTENHHLERGYCCGNGCLHCPFGHVNVPPPENNPWQFNNTGPDTSGHDLVP